jgi:Short-chain dehydrogenases of various substrate specificities
LRPVAIITGASMGLGQAISQALAQAGYRLVLAARSQEQINRMAAEFVLAGGEAIAVPTDVTKPADLERLVKVSLAQFGRIDVLVNNAGVSEAFEPALEGDTIADRTMHTNLLALMQLTRLVLPTMKTQRSGHIINIASVAGHVALPERSSYATSKHGVRGFSEALRRELRPMGIKVSMVSPGFIRTEMTREMRIPMPGPEIVARAVLSLLRRPRPEIVVPWYYHFPIWLNRCCPSLVDFFLSSWLVNVVRRK